MKLEHEFTVPAPVDEAWKVLLDVERVAPCMPGATLLTVHGDNFTGTVKVKVGPIQVTYKGQAKFASLDESAHRAVIEASGKETRGSGTAAATVTAVLLDAGGSTTNVKVETDLDVTGKPAQFGRGVMAEVAAKLIGQFSNCLAEELASPATAATGTAEVTDTGTAVLTTPPEAPAPTAPPTAPSTETETPVTAAPAKAAPARKTAAKKTTANKTTAKKTAAKTTPAKATTEKAAPVAGAPTAPAAPAAASAPRQVPPPSRPVEPIDLFEVAGGSVAKRLAPVAALVALVLFILWRRRRH